MRPDLCFSMIFPAYFVIRKAPRRFFEITSSKSSALIRSIRLSLVIPALFTRMSMLPNCFCAAVTISLTAASSETSPFMATAFTPASSHIFTVSRAAASLPAKFTTTLQPLPASSKAMALPIPLEAPVTIAVLSFKLFIIHSLYLQ